jgi:hypothetical protein
MELTRDAVEYNASTTVPAGEPVGAGRSTT